MSVQDRVIIKKDLNVKTYLSKRGYVIRKKYLNEEESKKIRDELFMRPFTTTDFGQQEEPFPIYLENDAKFYVPKFYGLDNFGEPEMSEVPPGADIDLNFNLQLKPEQLIPAEKTIEAYRQKGGGILSLPCGFGKTILALYFISQIKKKTLVVVHKEFLMNQWIERIRFALPEAKIGILQGDKCQIEGNDIIIGMLQTLSMKEFANNRFDDIGHVIIDECHCIPSRVFSRALLKINSPYMLGISATPNRKDGLTKVLKYYIGDLVYMVKSADKNVVRVERQLYESENENYNKELLSYRGQVQMATMLNNICDYMKRTRCIVKRIVELINENEERQILVLSDRRQHLDDMFRLANEMGLTSVGYYIGGMKEKKLKESEACKLLLGTYPMASTGLDIPSLNAVVLASPRSDIIQSIGRIDRKKHETIQPIIIDCIDQFSVFGGQSKKRFSIFKKKGYEIYDYHINVDDNNFPIIKEKSYTFHTKKCQNESDNEDDGVHDSDNDEEVKEDKKYVKKTVQRPVSCFFDTEAETTNNEPIKPINKNNITFDTNVIGKRGKPNTEFKKKKVNEVNSVQDYLNLPQMSEQEKAKIIVKNKCLFDSF